MLLGGQTAVNPKSGLTLLLLSNYKFYKPMFTLGFCSSGKAIKGLNYVSNSNGSETPHREFFTRAPRINHLG